MIGNINHIAIVVPDLDVAAAHWRDVLGAEVSQAQILSEHGVRIVFCLLYTSPSPRDRSLSRMPSSA